MQFGRTQGILLLVLGFFLLAAQAYMSAQSTSTPAPPDQSLSGTPPEPHTTSASGSSLKYLTGIVGVGMLVVGGWMFASSPRGRDNERPPAKTGDGFPM